MLLPNLLRKALARLFSRLTLGSFPALDPRCRPCPVTPRFRPALEMLERRMMPTVTATYTAASGLFVVNAASSTTATAMTVTASTNNQVTLALTGDTFSLQGDAAGASSGDFVLSNGSSTLLIYTGSAPLVNFDINQRSNNEPLTFGLAAATSGVTNVNITGTGDAVTFNAINNLSGNLVDLSGSVTGNSAITVGGSVTITGIGVGTGTSNWGVKLESSVTAGSSGNVTIAGTGSASGAGNDYGVYVESAVSGGGNITVTGTGHGTGTSNWGVVVGSTVTAGTGNLVITGIGSSSGSGYDFGVGAGNGVGGALSAGGSVTITGTGQGSSKENWGVGLANVGNTVTAGSNLTITGIGSGSGSNNNYGVFAFGTVSGVGSVTITGMGQGTGVSNYGVKLHSGAMAGSGSITITGTGSVNGTGSTYGVGVNGVVSAGGSVTITGKGQGAGSRNYGVYLQDAVTAGSSGSVTITGTGSGSGSGFDYGVMVGGAVSAGGSVTVTGTGQGTGTSNWGVSLSGSVTAGSSGNITLHGIGSGSGAGSDFGVTVLGPENAGGAVTVTGTGQGTQDHNFGVYLKNSITAGGSVTITGIGSASGGGSGYNYGVNLDGTVSAGGSVTITGTGEGTAGESNFGIEDVYSITAGGSIAIRGLGANSNNTSNNTNDFGFYTEGTLSAGGSVTVIGTGQGSGTENWGVGIAAMVIAGSSGVVDITGIGSTNGSSDSEGLYIDGAVTAGGSITITGTGQGTGSDESGVLLYGNVYSGTSGSVILRGRGSHSGYNDNYGVYTKAAVSGGGTITITGTGNGTGTGNDGVVFKGIAAVVSKVNGILSISGSSNSAGTSASNYGVYIAGGGQVKATGSAAITVTGIGGQGSGNSNIGILVTGAGSAVTGSSGGISINGTGRGSGSGSYGVAIELGGLVQTASTGAVSLVGQAPSTTAALYFDFGHSSKVEVATGNVALTGDIIDLSDPDSISSTSTSGTSHLAFQAYTHGRAIVVGGGSDAPNALTFTSTDLAAIVQGPSDGFGLITIGSATGANPMSLGGQTHFTTNLSLQAHGGLTLQIPDGNPPPMETKLNVTAGTLYLNNDPLHLITPTNAPITPSVFNMLYASLGTAGTTFLGLPQGSIATDSAGYHYYITYPGNTGGDVVLVFTKVVPPPPPNPASPGAGAGRGRGRS